MYKNQSLYQHSNLQFGKYLCSRAIPQTPQQDSDSFISRDDARALCPGQSLAVLSGGVQSSSICSSAPGAWLRAAGLCDWSFGDRVSQGNVSCLALKVPCDRN